MYVVDNFTLLQKFLFIYWTQYDLNVLHTTNQLVVSVLLSAMRLPNAIRVQSASVISLFYCCYWNAFALGWMDQIQVMPMGSSWRHSDRKWCQTYECKHLSELLLFLSDCSLCLSVCWPVGTWETLEWLH